MEHTKDEWKLRKECQVTYFIELDSNRGIITVFTDNPEITKEVGQLITAAPDLLAACEIGLSYAPSNYKCGNSDCLGCKKKAEDIKTIKEAIAKARKEG